MRGSKARRGKQLAMTRAGGAAGPPSFRLLVILLMRIGGQEVWRITPLLRIARTCGGG